ncbi:MAG: PASTA domain-containing protein, partial [Terracidiphilus sp.]
PSGPTAAAQEAPAVAQSASQSPPADSQAMARTSTEAASNQVAIITTNDKLLKVPSLVGLPLRKVIEVSAAAGVQVQMTGSGTAREQAPAAGTLVAAGTQIVVRCAR